MHPDIDLDPADYRVIRPRRSGLFPRVLAWTYGLGALGIVGGLWLRDWPNLLAIMATRQFAYSIGLSLILTIIAARSRRH